MDDDKKIITSANNGKKVDIYSTPTCHFCHATKDYFKENNIEFTDHDVSMDENARKQMLEESGQMGVPVIIISWKDGETEKKELVIGFDQSKLAEILKIP